MPLTIEQRLDKLLQRHEALAETVELMALQDKTRWEQQELRWQRQDKLMEQVLEGLAKLSFADYRLDQRVKTLEDKTTK